MFRIIFFVSKNVKRKKTEGKEKRERKKEVKETKGVNQEPQSLPGSSEHSREDW
jgi:hypothetical protein